MARTLAALLVVVLFLAGCTGDSGSSSSSKTATTSAPAPVANATAGSITGNVVDEEQRPVGGVRVAIIELNMETETDSAGAFTFNGLEGGTYQVMFERLGYQSTAKKVDVVLGEVTTINVLIQALVIADEPYVVTDQRTFYFNFAWYYVSRAVPIVNQSTLNGQTCDPCVFHIPMAPKPKAVMTETLWTRSISQTGVNENIEPYYCIGWTVSCTVDGTLVDRSLMTSRDSYTWTDAGAKALDKTELLRLEVLAGFPGIMFQQRGDIYTHFAYLDTFPDDFSILPPA